MSLLTQTRGYADSEVELVATRILELCRAVAGSDEEVLAALCSLANFHIVKGDLPTAASVVQEIVELSRTSGLAAFVQLHDPQTPKPSHGRGGWRRFSVQARPSPAEAGRDP